MVARRLAALVVCVAGIALLLPTAPALAVATAPKIEEVSVTDVRDSSATLNATIDPEGAVTTYKFEYATAGGSFAPVAGGEGQVTAGEGSAGVPVSVHMQVGLSPASQYQFHVIVENQLGGVTSEPVPFVTQSIGNSFALPDGREWEMVSPPQKEGALLGWIGEDIVQASADGEAFTDWTSFAADEQNPAGSSNNPSTVFVRGSNGWSARMISPPHERFAGISIGEGAEYRFFSEDLSESVLQPFGSFTALSPEAIEQGPYVRADYLNGDPEMLCSTNCYTPLLTDADTSPGAKFGNETEGVCKQTICGPQFVDATPDLGHVLLKSTVPLTSEVTPESEGSQYFLYEWTNGKLTFIGPGEVGSTNPGGGSDYRHAISNDGSRVIFSNANFFSGPVDGLKGLLMRDTETGKVVRLDIPNNDAAPFTGEEQSRYMTASSDGSKVFFIDSSGLTAESSNGGLDLYEYDVNAPEGEKLTDLSVDRNGSEAANAEMVLGASEDGSYVYFTAGGVLAPGASPGGCGVFETPGTLCNIYLYHEGAVEFVAAVSATQDAETLQNFSKLPVRVSPNGRWLAFMSSLDLTGYDTRDALTGQADQEVYLFDSTGGKLTCASCDPTGARPVGFAYEEGPFVLSAVNKSFVAGTPIASSLPPWTQYELGVAAYQSRYLSNSGRLFFNSHDALTSQDVNGTGDVYEYEPAGVGDCSSAGTTFSTLANGCIALISSGASNEESGFLDASETGADVFFLTSAKLAPQDFDTGPDVYDARECNPSSRCIAPPPVQPPPCNTGESCKPAPTPQPGIFGLPSSATFSGIGNVTESSTRATKPKSLTRAQKLTRALRVCGRLKARSKRSRCKQRARRTYGKAASEPRRGSTPRRGL